LEEAVESVIGAAGEAFAARAVVLAPVGGAAALVVAKAASVERTTAPATDELASAPAEPKVVPVGKFAVLKPDGRTAVTADAEAAPFEGPPANKVEGALAAKTAPGDGSTARTPDRAVAAFADTAAVPVEGFTASDNAVADIAASATGRVAAALAESALLCHVEHAERSILA